MPTNDFVYLGYANGTGTKDAPNWRLVPNTPEAIDEGKRQGYTAVSIFSMSHEPEKGRREPLRRGPLVLDFDCKADPRRAIVAAQNFVRNLCMYYGLDVRCLRYWISGGKGCHIELDASLIGSEDGSTRLHVIYQTLVRILAAQCLGIASEERELIDMQLYCGGKGRLLRLPNIRRENGRYKVPVAADEFLSGAPDDLIELTSQPREIPPVPLPYTRSDALASLFNDIKDMAEAFTAERLDRVLDSMNRCAFLSKCVEHADTLSEPEWWAFISILVTLGPLGYKLIHLFSRKYPGYSREETEKKIQAALAEGKPKTCAYIKEQGWVQCSPECIQHSPCSIWKAENKHARNSDFIHLDDGLYTASENGPIKICSPLRVLATGSDYNGWNWCRVVELIDPNQNKKVIVIPMRDINDLGAKWISDLLDGGLILSPYPHARKKLWEYISQIGGDCEYVKVSDKIGWMPSGVYLLPDISYGSGEKVMYIGQQKTKFLVSGTLEDWKNDVGGYCAGNPMLVLATAFALTGIVLEPLNMEGGGLHIYGNSSTGKSSLAIIAGSVCGGGGQDGFIRQWRSTDNALEKTAASHNDNFLVLDEVGQANCVALYKSIYMLANKEGKARLTSDCRQRNVLVWNLNFLSTGELTIGDKIREDGKSQVMAGQEIRVIDLPIDGGCNENLFQDCHDCESPGQLSVLLKANAKRVYGAPMRAFLEMFTSDKGSLTDRLKACTGQFCQQNLPENCSSQVERVLRKFSLIAAVGELATERGIFPYREGEVMEAAARYFRVWLAQRQGVQNGEVLAALERIRSHFEASNTYYLNLDDSECWYRRGSPRPETIGYKYLEQRKWVYFTLSPTLKQLFGNANRRAVIEELLRLNWVARNSNGNVLESKSIMGQNMRGMGFIPEQIQ